VSSMFCLVGIVNMCRGGRFGMSGSWRSCIFIIRGELGVEGMLLGVEGKVCYVLIVIVV